MTAALQDNNHVVVPIVKGAISGNLVVLQKKASKLDPVAAWMNLAFTSRHPHRIGDKAIEADTGRSAGREPSIALGVADGYDQYYFTIVHHVDKNQNGFYDKILISSYDSLENLIEVLELLERGKWR